MNASNENIEQGEVKLSLICYVLLMKIVFIAPFFVGFYYFGEGWGLAFGWLCSILSGGVFYYFDEVKK